MRLKLGMAMLAAGLLSATAIAQDPGGAFAGQVPVNCALKKAVSSRNAKVGQDIMAVTEKPTKVNGTDIPRGSMLTGHVVDVTPYKKGQTASITVVFDRLQPKKGDSFAVEASVYQISLSDNQIQAQHNDRDMQDMGMRGSAAEQMTTSAVRGGADNMNNRVQGMESVGGPVKVMSAIPGVALSAVSGGAKSGVMTSSKEDVDLAGGTEMVVGVKSK